MTQDLVQHATADDAALRSHPGTDIDAGDARIWAARISERWRASVQAIIDVGRILIEAKARMPHGAFGRMCETDLPFSTRTAQRLMAIASDIRLSNPTIASYLPASWTTLSELTDLTDDEFSSAFEQKIIRPDMVRADVDQIRALTRHSQPILENSSAVEQGAVNALVAGSIPASPANDEPAPMPGGGLAIAHRRDNDQDPREFFPTPPWATRALVERVLRHLNREGPCKFQTVWEPACGEGHMAEVLREYFRDVEASDAHDYKYRGVASDVFKCDFLTVTGATGFDWIITNPPFRKSTEFVLKALEQAHTGVAMFVRLAWIEGVNRYNDLLRDKPPSLLSIFTERAPLHKARWEPEGSTFTAYAWLVWINGMPPQPPFWIPPGCRQALAKPDDVKRFGKTEVEEEAA